MLKKILSIFFIFMLIQITPVSFAAPNPNVDVSIQIHPKRVKPCWGGINTHRVLFKNEDYYVSLSYIIKLMKDNGTLPPDTLLPEGTVIEEFLATNINIGSEIILKIMSEDNSLELAELKLFDMGEDLKYRLEVKNLPTKVEDYEKILFNGENMDIFIGNIGEIVTTEDAAYRFAIEEDPLIRCEHEVTATTDENYNEITYNYRIDREYSDGRPPRFGYSLLNFTATDLGFSLDADYTVKINNNEIQPINVDLPNSEIMADFDTDVTPVNFSFTQKINNYHYERQKELNWDNPDLENEFLPISGEAKLKIEDAETEYINQNYNFSTKIGFATTKVKNKFDIIENVANDNRVSFSVLMNIPRRSYDELIFEYNDIADMRLISIEKEIAPVGSDVFSIKQPMTISQTNNYNISERNGELVKLNLVFETNKNTTTPEEILPKLESNISMSVTTDPHNHFNYSVGTKKVGRVMSKTTSVPVGPTTPPTKPTSITPTSPVRPDPTPKIVESKPKEEPKIETKEEPNVDIIENETPDETEKIEEVPEKEIKIKTPPKTGLGHQKIGNYYKFLIAISVVVISLVLTSKTRSKRRKDME